MNKATTAKRIFYKGKAIFSLVAAAALTVGLLAGCTSAENPVVTSDNIEPNTVAADAMAQAAGNGKNYTYYWYAEDVEDAVQKMKTSYEEQLAELEQKIADNKAGKAVDDFPLEKLQEDYDGLKGSLDEIMAEYRKGVEEQATLNPIITPQEAANFGAVAIEQCYGMDLSQQTLDIFCIVNDSVKTGSANGRSVWSVSPLISTAPNGGSFSKYTANCTLDATTGEILMMSYMANSEEISKMQKTPIADCYQDLNAQDPAWRGGWLEDAPSYRQTTDALAQQVKTALAGSVLAGGTEITEITPWLENVYNDNKENYLCFDVTFSDGRSFTLKSNSFYLKYSTYDFGGFPLRAYSFTLN